MANEGGDDLNDLLLLAAGAGRGRRMDGRGLQRESGRLLRRAEVGEPAQAGRRNAGVHSGGSAGAPAAVGRGTGGRDARVDLCARRAAEQIVGRERRERVS